MAVQDVEGVSIAHLTAFDIGRGEAEQGHGVAYLEPIATPVTVRDSILAFLSGYGLWLPEGTAATYLRADYTAFHECAAGDAFTASLGPQCLSVDPQFSNRITGIDTLAAGSPCIDAGDPASPYAAEPDPNGCAANLGAYGNTETAATADGAPHCE